VLKKLREVIGADTVIEPEWQLLLAELGTVYEDKARLVIDVANCVISWANSLMLLAEDDSYSEWAEELLERVNGRIKVYFEVRVEPGRCYRQPANHMSIADHES